MPQASAYSEEHGRNITLDEAHVLYFAQGEGRLKRFHFRCGDPKCRTMFQPLIVCALYDQEDLPGKKRKSPYFRAHSDYPHIVNCTWIKKNAANSQKSVSHNPVSVVPSGSVLESCGLVFKVEHNKISKRDGLSSPKEMLTVEEADENIVTECANMDGQTPRPQTTRFMASVAASYFKFTEEQRRRIPLTIEGECKDSFYNVCIPVRFFHPFYQAKRIYHGRVRIAELTNVFMVSFFMKMSPIGDKGQRTTIAEIKILKRWLEENDRALATILHDISDHKKIAWCFLYSTILPSIVKGKAQFTLDNPNLIAIVDEIEIKSLQIGVL